MRELELKRQRGREECAVARKARLLRSRCVDMLVLMFAADLFAAQNTLVEQELSTMTATKTMSEKARTDRRPPAGRCSW